MTAFKITGDHVGVTRRLPQFVSGATNERSYLRIAKCPGEIRMSEHVKYNGRIVSVTVSRRSDTWYAAILVECRNDADLLRAVSSEDMVRQCIGVDLGVREIWTSDGVGREVPRHLRHSERLLRRRQQSLSRKVKGSANSAKSRLRVARTHMRIAERRGDWLHKLTTELVASTRTIVLEDLNVKGMLKNHRLAKSVSDTGFAEFRRQVEYKVRQCEDREVVIADRWFPSSKMCSACGTKTKSLPLHIRAWTCDTCGAEHHRDLNAAINLENYAGGSSVSACGPLLASSVRGSAVQVTSSVRSRNPSSRLSRCV